MIGVPAVNAYIITAVSDMKNLTSVLAFVWSSYSFSYIFAPTVGASLVTVIGMQWVLRLSAALCAVATLIFFFLRSQYPQKKNTENLQNTVALDSKKLRRQIIAWSVFFSIATFFMTVGRTFVPTFLAEQIRLDEFHVGLFGSISFAGTTFIGIVTGRLSDKWRKPRAISLCLLFYVSSIVPLLFISEPSALMPIAFLYGGSVVMGSVVSSYVGTVAPPHKRGFWVSVPQTLSLVAAFAAPYLGGYLYAQQPYYAFAVSLIPIPLLFVVALTMLKE